MVTINLVDYGTGNVIDGEIYINRRLCKYPRIYNKVLNHELEHISGNDPDWKEEWDWGYAWFMVRNPSTWIQLSPIIIINDQIIYSKKMAALWAIWAGTYIILAIIYG